MSAILNLDEIQKFIEDCVDEMYLMDKGVPILKPKTVLRFCDVRLTRKQTKHIIEQRKEEGKSAGKIKEILTRLPEVVAHYDFEIPNSNQRHPGSIMRIKIFGQAGDGLVVVLDKKIENYRDIITAFIRDPQGMNRLKKKLQESASGETPRP